MLFISEIYHSLQGEGWLTGTPSVFVRTSGCNLRCDFCDTPFASWHPEGQSMSLDQIEQAVENVLRRAADEGFPELHHVVLTGGEPLLPREITELCSHFHETGYHITIETAGTIYRELDCDLMSISPKFANSTPTLARAGAWREKHESTRFRPEIVSQLIERYSCQLKFVIDRTSDLADVHDFLQAACPNWQQRPELSERVMLMPQGIDLATLQEKEAWLKPLCDQQGFTFCPRRHIQWYGNKRGT